MSPVDQALQTVIGWFRVVLGVFLAVFGVIEAFLRTLLVQLGVPGRLQGTIILVVAVLFIVIVLRLFGGFFRILLVVFLILLILHILAPAPGPLTRWPGAVRQANELAIPGCVTDIPDPVTAGSAIVSSGVAYRAGDHRHI